MLSSFHRFYVALPLPKRSHPILETLEPVRVLFMAVSVARWFVTPLHLAAGMSPLLHLCIRFVLLPLHLARWYVVYLHMSRWYVACACIYAGRQTA